MRLAESGVNNQFQIQQIPIAAPWQWLRQGARDIQSCHYRSLFYGLCYVLMGFAISAAHAANPNVAIGVGAGFFFACPFLAIGVYELSRQIQRGEPADMLVSLFCWCRNPRAICLFSLVLAIVLIVWLAESLALFNKLSANHFWSTDTFTASISAFLSDPVLLALSVGWILTATLVYMISVVSVPMLLDQEVSAGTAIWLSAQCFLRNTLVLLLWAIIIFLVIGFSLLLKFIPLFLTGPLIGHASWHAYQACIGVMTDGH